MPHWLQELEDEALRVMELQKATEAELAGMAGDTAGGAGGEGQEAGRGGAHPWQESASFGRQQLTWPRR